MFAHSTSETESESHTYCESDTRVAFWAAFGAEFEALGLRMRRPARAILGTLKNAQTSALLVRSTPAKNA